MGPRVSCVTDTLLIIDGHSVAFRAFYALPSDTFRTSTGQYTNAVYGFVSMLVRLLETERPTHVGVAFDVSRHSFRTEEYPEYKGTRAETPPEFIGQVEIIQDVLSAMGIRSLTKDGYEADDILATLSTEAAAQGWRVLVASGDRDSFQLVTDRVTVLYPGQGPGDLREMTPEAIEAKYGLPPQRYPELAALVGETSDNLPGVPGVGPKTAAQWITKFDGLDNLLAHADEVGGKRGEALREHLEDVRRNRRLNHLLTDLDVGATPQDLLRGPTDRRAVEDLFDTLEFTGLRTRVLAVADVGVAAGAGTSPDREDPDGTDEDGAPGPEVTVADPTTDIAAWVAAATTAPLGLWVEGSRRPAAGDTDRLALASGTRALVVETASVTPAQDEALSVLLRDSEDLVVHDGKGTWHALRGRGWDLHRPAFDVELAAYLLRPEQRGYDLAALTSRYLGRDVSAVGEDDALFVLDELGGEEGSDAPSPAQQRCAEAAATLLELRAALVPLLAEQDETDLLSIMELPLQGVLARMEDTGIAVDTAVLDQLRDELAAGVERAATEAFAAIGRQVNLSSPKQLQEVLFDQLDMPRTKKTKTGWTTNAEALQELWARTGHPFLEHLLTHRDRIKLLQMVETLRATVGVDQRIHTTFSQVVAATGRLASSDPNLQNIPARTADGVRIRHAFVAGPGYAELMSADYSQIEMRIMAHLSRDAGLIEAFRTGEDLHRTMASMVFGTPVEEVTPEQRTRIKATSYGLAYGLSSYGLSQQLGIPVPEAQELRERYFERFGGVRDYLERLVSQARRDGYTQTMFHRRRYLPDLNSDNRQRREMAERAALNAPIQGSAADIIKIAMVRVDRALREAGLSSRLLLQIHDELIIEVWPGEFDEVESLVRREMASPVAMDVELTVAVGRGHSWMEAAH
ncbi:DNA polymerase I [Actinomyces polynesiensis]|uniref:DNA polymerase I n=1 Tax=Actinomyces polynesiensis TaxID=1325934 RepID=UPI00164EB6A4|nr:DNA polymerase I [Actinomyces polynesiensis]